MALIAADGNVRRIPTTARDVYDVVGAGDTVTAYLATSLAAGATAYEAAVVANFAAGVEVGKLGADTVSPAEVLEAQRKRVARWQQLCAKYAPAYEAAPKRAATA